MKTIKLFVSVISLIVVSGCETKFPSKEQAKNACEEWELKGNRISYKRETRDFDFDYLGMRRGAIVNDVAVARVCGEEVETNQVLGYESKSIQNGTWKNGDDERREIVKHFRY